MIQNIVDNPFIFCTFVALLIFLNIGAALRVRHDRTLKDRAKVNRREKPRAEKDRRWIRR